LQLFVASPNALCMSEFWDEDSNVIIAILQPEAHVSADLVDEFSNGAFRRQSVQQYVEDQTSLRVIPNLWLHAHSQVLNFFPLFSAKSTDKRSADAAVAQTSLAGTFPIFSGKDGSGIGAFIARINPSLAEELAERGEERYRASVQVSAGPYDFAEATIQFTFSEMWSDSLISGQIRAHERIFASYAREDKDV
jgi:hypothetical protein